MKQGRAVSDAALVNRTEAEIDRIRAMLLDSIAGEFVQPLNLIGMERDYLQVYLARRGDAPDEKIAAALNGIGSAAVQLNRLLSNCVELLNCLQGSTAPVIVPMDMGAVLEDICADGAKMAELLDIALTVKTPEEPCCVCADQTMVQRILLNLLSNALRACAPGGHVSMTLCRGTKDVSLSVEDDGCGVPAAFCAHAFDPAFEQEKPNRERYLGGAGVGLYLTGEYCRLLGWKPEMRQTKHGTRVVLQIPREQLVSGEKVVFHAGSGARQLRSEALRAAVRQELCTVPGLENA